MLFDSGLIGIAQIDVHIGNFEANVLKIEQQINLAKQRGIKLLVFPELTVCGYPPRDFLELESFIISCEKAIEQITLFTDGISVVVGSPSRNTTGIGKRLFNSAYFISNKKVQGIFHKTLLPNYDVFDEYRYFESNRNFDVIDFDGSKIGIAICEDVWNSPAKPLYQVSPIAELKSKGAEIIINISASPFSYDQDLKRKEILRENALTHQVDIVYCNFVGAQTELIFDGGSFFMNKKGEVLAQAPFFTESILTALDNFSEQKDSKIALIHSALVLGIRDYFKKLGFTKALVGLSGGIDSAVTFALAAEALGNKNVLGVLMPSQFSSDHSIDDAKQLAINLGSQYEMLNIESVFESYQVKLSELFKDLPFGLAEENLQARVRGTLLMTISNKFGHIVLNTSNKSESAVGYGTLYGDMCGGLSVLGDVYKTEVFELALHINKDKEIIPINSIQKPPSAELRPNQKDSDSLPEYDVLDKILYQYIEKSKGSQEIINLGFDENLVSRVLKLVNLNEYKRYQTPPVLRISPKAFGMGRRMPIAAKY